MNPKDKKTIGILVPIQSNLTGRNLKKGIAQLYEFYERLTQLLHNSNKITIDSFLKASEILDRDLLKLIEQDVVKS
ncbi:MAG: hypothetical protein K9W44_12745 [Candidatus Lokiarchaeota archaeon]|nr:hypothetical protein [Candidatus Harpocratesius repetitus]